MLYSDADRGNSMAACGRGVYSKEEGDRKL